MKEEKCANYERDNVLMSEMEQNVADFMNKDLENTLKISREQLDKYVDEIYFNKPQREIFLMNAHGILDNRKSKTDPIVESVRQKLLDRSNVGVKKYNTTLQDNNSDNYLNHLQQELMDAANYVEKLLQQKKDITQIVKEYPNDTELGTVIRAIYGQN